MKLYLLIIFIFCSLSVYAQHRCSGGANCNACTNCNYCKNCNEGGGICSVCHPEKYNHRRLPITKPMPVKHLNPKPNTIHEKKITHVKNVILDSNEIEDLSFAYKSSVSSEVYDATFLKWWQKEDKNISMLATCSYLNPTGGKTLDGKQKAKWEHLRIYIFNQSGEYRFTKIEKGENLEPFSVRHCMTFRADMNLNISDHEKLFEIAKKVLDKYNYDGYVGKFQILDLPTIGKGDTIELINNKLREKSGYYKVDAVNISFNNDGKKLQEISIDYKINSK
jgi:hypothetical protein